MENRNEKDSVIVRYPIGDRNSVYALTVEPVPADALVADG